MTAQALEQSALESKDKAQLVQIAEALGVKTTTRSKKADIIDQILAMTGASPALDAAANGDASGGDGVASTASPPDDRDAPPAEPTDGSVDAPATAESAPDAGAPEAPTSADAPATDVPVAAEPTPDAGAPGAPGAAEPTQQDDEPKAEWELALEGDGGAGAAGGEEDAGGGDDSSRRSATNPDRADRGGDETKGGQRQQAGQGNTDSGNAGAGESPDGESRSKRRRRRRKNRGGQDGPQGEDRDALDDDEPTGNEPVTVEGYLDMRDEGYGFLRVNNYLASKSDSYVPVKLSRQFGLRKGDHIRGLSRPAGRNEKNPAMLEIQSVNGRPPEEAKKRRRFEDLTALFPDERLRMEDPADPANMTARIIDLVSPIGKGQRGLIVSPPKAGKTTVMKTIVSSIEKNNPECKTIVLLIDERPEEVTDMRRLVQGEVIASTFDKPSDQHTQIAEMAIEKAKRMVEYGEDVVVILDGITRLSRAYNLAAPASGRILSGGIDAGALYPPKRFFGAARNVEEGGSLTILATALVETNSRMDEAVFEEFKGTGNMELRLDRRLAERRIYPAIDVDASSTRHEELLFDRRQLQMVWKLRRVLSGLAADGNAAPGLELLVDRLKTFRSNDEFLTEIAKQPGM